MAIQVGSRVTFKREVKPKEFPWGHVIYDSVGEVLRELQIDVATGERVFEVEWSVSGNPRTDKPRWAVREGQLEEALCR